MDPFGERSISIGLHAISDLPGDQQATAIVDQGVMADRVGFDGVTMSEHHAGFTGYVPQPLAMCAVILAKTVAIWAGPCPVLLNLRNPVLLAEELAWVAACFPGRFGAAMAPGYAEHDFVTVGMPHTDRAGEFARRLEHLTALLSGDGPLAADPAVARWSLEPAPLLSAANSESAVHRAARFGLGVVFPGGESPQRLARLAALYRDGGGRGPVVWIKNAWLGDPKRHSKESFERLFRDAASTGMRQRAGFSDSQAVGSPQMIVDTLLSGIRTIGASSVNLRLHASGATRGQVRDQIAEFGASILPAVRAAWPP